MVLFASSRSLLILRITESGRLEPLPVVTD